MYIGSIFILKLNWDLFLVKIDSSYYFLEHNFFLFLECRIVPQIFGLFIEIICVISGSSAGNIFGQQ